MTDPKTVTPAAATAQATETTVPTADRPDRPRRSGLLTTMDIVVPFGLYYLLHWAGQSDLVALLAGAAVSLVLVVVSLVRTRRIDAFAAITLLALVSGVAVALLSGNARQLLIRSAWVSAPFALLTLASLRWPRPITFLATLALLRHRTGNLKQLWATNARFRTAWRHITVMWGVIALLNAVVGVVFAYTLPIPVVPVADTLLTIATMLLLQVPTHLFLLRSGTWRQAFGGRRRGPAAQ